MSAYKDNSQGHCFIYIPSVKIKTEDGNMERVNQIKENLEKLQKLHHKLHAMLEELNQIVPTKGKKS